MQMIKYLRKASTTANSISVGKFNRENQNEIDIRPDLSCCITRWVSAPLIISFLFKCSSGECRLKCYRVTTPGGTTPPPDCKDCTILKPSDCDCKNTRTYLYTVTDKKTGKQVGCCSSNNAVSSIRKEGVQVNKLLYFPIGSQITNSHFW